MSDAAFLAELFGLDGATALVTGATSGLGARERGRARRRQRRR